MELPPMPYPVFNVDAWLKDNFYKDNDGIIHELEKNSDYMKYGIFSKVGSQLYDNVRNYLIDNLMHYEQDNNKLTLKEDHRFPEDGEEYLQGNGFRIMLIELFGRTYVDNPQSRLQDFLRDYKIYASMGKWHDNLKKLLDIRRVRNGQRAEQWGESTQLHIHWQFHCHQNNIKKITTRWVPMIDKSNTDIASLKSQVKQQHIDTKKKNDELNNKNHKLNNKISNHTKIIEALQISNEQTIQLFAELNNKISNQNNIITELQNSNKRTNKMIKYIILFIMFITIILLMSVIKINH